MNAKSYKDILKCIATYNPFEKYDDIPNIAVRQAQALNNKPNPDAYIKILDKAENYKIDKALKTLKLKKEKLQIELLEQEINDRKNNIQTGSNIIIQGIEI